jgi:type VI protein secretion system component VasF
VTEQERANGLLASISERLIRVLPPAFLMLIFINVLALGFLFWFVDARANHTASVLNQLLQACLQR